MPLLYTLFLLALHLSVAAEENDRNGGSLGESEVIPPRPFLRMPGDGYRNFALQTYTPYPDHTVPYNDRPRAYYGPMGDYLITGYGLYSWNERRLPGLEYGSAIAKNLDVFTPIFDHVIVGRDGYGNWGYSLIVGDGLMARFTPLTLSKTDLNGTRLDVHTPHLELTLAGSRIERPVHWVEGMNTAPWMIEGTHYADATSLLLGGRAQTRIGALRLGLNGANVHIYDSTQPGNSLKGIIRPDHPRIFWLGLEISDDSPADGGGGAVVQELQLVVNGEARPDIRPRVVSHGAGVRSAVGTYSQATGEFRGTGYKRRGYPYFADYLYRFEHEDGIDVSANTNLTALLETFVMEPPGTVLRADGDEVVVAMFDLSQDPAIESVVVEALLANDYRVRVFTLIDENPRARGHATRWRPSSPIIRLRAPGNVQDLSNLERRRFRIGEHTGLFTYSADVAARPARPRNRRRVRPLSPLFALSGIYVGKLRFSSQAPHFGEHGSAYFVTASHWYSRGRLGAEYFAINPKFKHPHVQPPLKPPASANYIGVGFSQYVHPGAWCRTTTTATASPKDVGIDP